LDGVYYCPHHPSEECACRKPKAGMLVWAAREFGIDLRRVFMVGDKASDLEAGQRVGCRTVLVLTGYGEQSRETFNKYSDFRPDYISTDLNGAAKWILAEKGVKV